MTAPSLEVGQRARLTRDAHCLAFIARQGEEIEVEGRLRAPNGVEAFRVHLVAKPKLPAFDVALWDLEVIDGD